MSIDNNTNSSKGVNLLNAKIGDWTVISKLPKKGGDGTHWLCRCICGLEREYTTSYLNSTPGSQCPKCREKRKKEKEDSLIKDIVGKTFGDYTVIRFEGRNSSGVIKWLCKCKCGHERLFTPTYLYGNSVRRATQCLHCHNSQRELDNRVTDHIPHRFWARLQDRAYSRGYVFDITKEYLYDLYVNQKKRCALSGEYLYFTKLNSNFNRYTNASVDRIDSEKGYVVGNIQFVLKTINMMKWTLPNSEFIELCCKIYKWNNKG